MTQVSVQYPRGYRNNNPGNLRPLLGTQIFEGQTGVDRDPAMGAYCVFADAAHGIRAIVRELLTYNTKDRCGTVRQMIDRWAPPSDSNPTAAYVSNVATALKVDPDVPFTLTAATAPPFVAAIIHQELGNPATFGLTAWYPDETIAQGIALAF